MTQTAQRVPSWGAFKGIRAKSDEPCPSGSPEFADLAVQVPEPSSSANMKSAFDMDSADLADQNFYASEHDAARTEEEFEELGEGAIRQIGRNFVSLVGMTSAATLLLAVGVWSFQDGDSALSGSDVIASVEADEPESITIASNQFYITEPRADAALMPDEVRQFIEVEVTLPVPSVLAVAEEGETPNQSILVEYAGFSGPAPFPREFAMAALSELEEGPLAQGSDDESMPRSDTPPKNKPWVSVMIPMERPVF